MTRSCSQSNSKLVRIFKDPVQLFKDTNRHLSTPNFHNMLFQPRLSRRLLASAVPVYPHPPPPFTAILYQSDLRVLRRAHTRRHTCLMCGGDLVTYSVRLISVRARVFANSSSASLFKRTQTFGSGAGNSFGIPATDTRNCSSLWRLPLCSYTYIVRSSQRAASRSCAAVPGAACGNV